MTRRPIGYYVHHQGAGHWDRARAIAATLDRPVTLLGTFDELQRRQGGSTCVDLPDDRIAGFDGIDGEPERPKCLHYAPLGVAAIRSRMAAIAAWIEACDPVLMIVDVSVEVTLLARLLSVPTVVVRLAGERTDTPHLEAFRAADRLLAPFPPALDAPATPPWVIDKTIYAGFLSAAPPPSAGPANPRKIVVMFGRGGTGGPGAILAEAARSLPDYGWHVLGPMDLGGAARPSNLHLHGWVEDVSTHLSDAALVFGSGGDGVLATVATLGKRFICVPEARPYGEQRVKAEALQRLGAAILHDAWVSGTDWKHLVHAGLAIDPTLMAGMTDRGALRRTADAIEGLAEDIEAYQNKRR